MRFFESLDSRANRYLADAGRICVEVAWTVAFQSNGGVNESVTTVNAIDTRGPSFGRPRKAILRISVWAPLIS